MLKQQIITGLIVWVLLTLGVTYLVTGQLNPITIYQSSDSLFAKIIISVLLLFVLYSLVQIFAISVIPDNPCPICNKGLIAYASIYGPGDFCPNCRANGRSTMYHRNCFKAAGKCPVCAQHDPMNDLHKF